MSPIHLVVSGRVQGVGFRWFVRERARRLGVAGWVRNREDGSVELAASGDPDALRALVEAVRLGPPGSRVHDVRSLDPAGNVELPHPFTIHR